MLGVVKQVCGAGKVLADKAVGVPLPWTGVDTARIAQQRLPASLTSRIGFGTHVVARPVPA
ncbi:hypothetical protein KHQ06_33455 [Nocardia tengchongensis]|uniref:Uncharacterized protein n=1 Tax=Nocardia tengchongensis TaxID=2055889 RepID=A0ABX8CPX9_9NOCA|nr:hypothetical protein [Nocardia tengchongensis]QVI20934.1 hypothetical protein KHQ06_33455 [Nocardia tengchongensis]